MRTGHRGQAFVGVVPRTVEILVFIPRAIILNNGNTGVFPTNLGPGLSRTDHVNICPL